MDPVRVWARNFRTYRALEWVPQNGLTTVLGRNLLGDGADSNGSGKSTLLECLFVGLFGPALPWSEYLTVGGDDTTCEVGLEFTHGEETYRVRRQYDSRGRGKSTLDLERQSEFPQDNGAWLPLTMNSQAETQAALVRMIGLSEATYVHSVHAPQGHRHFADPSLPPRERKDILADALGLVTWEKLKALVAADIRELERTVEGIEQRLGAFEDDLAQKAELEAAHSVFVAAFAQAARELVEAEAAEAKAREAHTEARGAADRVNALLARRDAARTTLAHLDRQAELAQQSVERAAAETAAIERLTPVAARADSLEAESRRIATADLERAAVIDKRDTLAKQEASLTDRIRALIKDRDAAIVAAKEVREEGGETTCRNCGQALAGEALAKAQASVERDAGRHEAKAAELAQQVRALTDERAAVGEQHQLLAVPAEIPAEQVAKVHEQLQGAREAVSEIARRTATLEALKGTQGPSQAEHESARQALAEAEAALAAAPAPDPEALGLLTRELERASTTVATARAADRQAQTELATSEERLRNLAGLAERAQESLAEKTRLTDRLGVLKALERSYGRDGIPALLLENHAIPQIEATAREVLEALGMPFRVELATQRENKGGGLRDTLDVVVHEPGGARSYATYSGGERTRLEVALRVGIARLIAQRSSSACALFALDELPWLDRSGQAALVEVLRGLTEFERVILISHDEVLADSFDHQVVVVRDEEGSRLEAAA